MSANPVSQPQPRQFIEIAKPLIERGIPVIPVRPCSKRGLFENQFDMATTDINIVRQWNAENTLYNVGAVGTPDTICILDCDAAGLVERIERETGHKMPRTFTVKSAGKGLPHFYFRQTEMSRAIGNQKAAEQFDLQSVNKYVVGPGSTLDNGKQWEVTDDASIADFPDWLAYWVLENCDHKHTAKSFAKAPSVHGDFDFGEFCQGGRGQTAYVRDDRDPEMRLNARGWEQWWKRSVEQHDHWDDEMKAYYPYLYDDPDTGKIIDRCNRQATKDAYDGFCEDHQPMTEEHVSRRAESDLQKIRQGE
jgi:hypothetical protein